jgi:hypothetical protein
MTMSDEGTRTPPNGSAWNEAQRKVADRNEQARRTGKEQRKEHDRRIAAIRRAQDERGNVQH